MHQQNCSVYGVKKMHQAMKRRGWRLGREQTGRKLTCASVAASIAGQKKYNRAVFFGLALLMLGPLNIAVVLLAPPPETAQT